MHEDTFAAEARLEESHWWFVQRRWLFEKLIREAGIKPTAAVLDIGTGTGANLRLLHDMGFSNVTGIDPSSHAARWCAAKGLGDVRQGDARALPLDDASIDFVMATDVVEHVEEDDIALKEIARVLRPGGLALITVPAFQSLWGLQDVKSFHYRRYRRGPFLRQVAAAGLSVRDSYYFNYLLFIPIFVARQIMRLLRVDMDSENELNSPLTNRVLKVVFRADVATARYIRPPFGVSILVLAEKNGN